MDVKEVPNQAPGGFSIGIDVGGTFTDLACGNGQSLWRAKSPTDRNNFGRGVLGACQLVADQVGLDLETFLGRVERFGLGTTAVTNALVEKHGVRAGLLTTAGFEDTISMARSRRVSEEGFLVPPWSPIDRSAVVGVDERVDRDGKVLQAVDIAAVRSAVANLIETHQIEALAVSFLWSFKNDENELAVVEFVRQEFPDLPVFSGVELHPSIREYERTLVAAVNAVLSTALDGIEALAQELADTGLRVPLLLLQTSGGTVTLAEARRSPVILVASGPAAGVMAAAEVCSDEGISDAICGDMGGTSFDLAVIADSLPQRSERGELHGMILAQPRIDTLSIGSGGGSIAWVDARGLLRVGPRSARAWPGPACYGNGGTDATITDALVVLGYIDPASFVGGTLDREASVRVCATLGESLGLSAEEAAWGIREIALAEMTKATRLHAGASGLDPRTLTLISYGGSGGLFTASIAAEANIPRVVVPPAASVLSAFGAASADVRRQRIKSADVLLDRADAGAIGADLERLGSEVARAVGNDGVPEQDLTVNYDVGVRFFRQTSEVSIALQTPVFDAEAIRAAFLEQYAARYGVGAVGQKAQLEVTFLRAVAIGRLPRATFAIDTSTRTGGVVEPSSHRAVYLTRAGSEQVPCYRTPDLVPGDRIDGPALADDVDTTVFVPRGATLVVGERRSLRLDVNSDAA
ncbi:MULTISPECIES: hydantoinase/oxoprolinase family protein [Rhodococcus]|uniref:hydantoinase/oxoprolinase family protein n=1 Tax=Rhodococcus TaxID=1827 RepID=UPI0019825016|nr:MULTISPECIES: hydantoinase/oxoprolinase family protein [Rhodococcus]MDI9977248.1 hydantoinase/oxoprolinase family protein [Rhodococcus sp. IEGM 1307]QSE85882.1 hydantoinase/oxoprolinase family protein [Rhodococcus koreensis]